MTIPHFARGLLAAALPAVLVLGGTTTPATAAGPTYGPWSSEVVELSARIAPANAKVARTYVQIRRSSPSDGDRQVRITWRPGKGKVHVSGVRSLEPGDLTTYRTGRIACGKEMTVTLMARARYGDSWSDWKSFAGTLTRSC